MYENTKFSFMAQMNGMEKRNFTNSAQNGGKTAKCGMVGMSAVSVSHRW